MSKKSNNTTYDVLPPLPDVSSLEEYGADSILPDKKKKSKKDVDVPRGTSELTAEENRQYIDQTLNLIDLDSVNFSSAVNIRNRVKLYFKLCAESGLRAVLPGLQLALGIDDPTWKAYLEGRKGTAATQKEFKVAETMLQHQTTMWMASGRIAPVAGIFELKSYHGRTEEQKYEVKDKDALGQSTTREELEKKYAGLELSKSFVPDKEIIGVDDLIIDGPTEDTAEGQND